MAPRAAPVFDVTPEKQGSITNFFYHQILFTPSVVTGDLSGHTCIVTGSNTGVGLEIARQFLDLGASKLILAVRNQTKGEAARQKLLEGRNGASQSIEVWNLDLSVYESIVEFAKQTASLERIDIVVQNAAIAPLYREFNKQTKHDEIIQVNYLSNALLTILLLDVLKSRPKPPRTPRITVVSSDVAAWTSFKERAEDPLLPSFDKPGKIVMTDRYFVSKTLGQLFLTELCKRVPADLAVINCASPGMCHDSELNRELDQTLQGKIAKVVMRRIGYTSAVGARMITDAAVKHGDESHGQYLALQKIKPYVSCLPRTKTLANAVCIRMAPIVYSEEAETITARLWEETMQELDFAHVRDIIKRLGV